MVEPLVVGCALAISACGGEPGDVELDATHGVTSSREPAAEESTGCDAVHAGGGWVNTAMPAAQGEFTLGFTAYPASSATPPLIDTVVGLSNGPADSFRDLGPIVRFNEYGYIDARDGGAYAGAFPYRTADAPYEFLLEVSIPAHRYTVWVRHRDALAKPFELLGENLAFRSEQSDVARLDTVGRFTDSAAGSLETCGFAFHAADAP